MAFPTTGLISTSDARDKTVIDALTAQELERRIARLEAASS